MWLWKRNKAGRGGKAPSAIREVRPVRAEAASEGIVDHASSGAVGGFSESARVELYREGTLYPLAPGEDVTEVVCSAPEAVFVQLGIELEVRLAGMSETAGDETFPMPEVFSLSELPDALSGTFRVEAKAEGRLLCLERQKLAVISEDLCRALLLELVSHQGAWLGRLLTAHDQVLGHRARLADYFYQQTVVGHQELAESELVRKVIAKVPRLPVSTGPLLAKMLDCDSSGHEIADLVRQDPALASLLLKAINSAQYGFEQKISDVDRAIMLIGFEGVYQVVMAEGLRRCLPNTAVFRRSYQRSLELSHIAFALSRVTGRAVPSEMATIALLHDLGRVVSALLGHQNPGLAPLAALIEPPVLGGELLKDWQLPEPVWCTVASQNYPEFAAPAQLDEVCRERVALLYVAELLHGLFVAREDPVEAVYLRDYMHLLGLDGQSLSQLWEKRLRPILKTRQNCLPESLRRL